MTDFKPNSHRYKNEQKLKQQALEEKKVNKVVTGNVKRVKKSEMSEKMSSAKEYLIEEIIVPTAKDTIWSLVTSAVEIMIFGSTGRGKKSNTASKVSYTSYYDRKRDDRRYSRESSSRNALSFDEFVLSTRGEAEEVLTRMDELIATYGMASVADLVELVGEIPNYTDHKYGWTDLRHAGIKRVRDGYLIEMPKAIVIE